MKAKKSNSKKEQAKKKTQIKELALTAVIMLLGLALLKYLPMYIFGEDILFDASQHIVVASFVLYFVYFFIDQNEKWKIPYFILCFVVLTVISIQRILANAHNDVGLLLGALISIIAIAIPRWGELNKKIKF